MLSNTIVITLTSTLAFLSSVQSAQFVIGGGMSMPGGMGMGMDQSQMSGMQMGQPQMDGMQMGQSQMGGAPGAPGGKKDAMNMFEVDTPSGGINTNMPGPVAGMEGM